MWLERKKRIKQLKLVYIYIYKVHPIPRLDRCILIWMTPTTGGFLFLLKVVAPAIELAQFHSRHCSDTSSTYVYMFAAPSRLDTSYPRWLHGASDDDLAYVFGAPLTDGVDPFPSGYSRSDRALAEAMLKYWSNFVKTGWVYRRHFVLLKCCLNIWSTWEKNKFQIFSSSI